jgi:putative tricarboxylic transport membrane protein
MKGTSIASAPQTRIGGVAGGVRDTFVHWWLVVRCSLIGTFIGVMPGLGSSVAQWVSYAHAAQTSPRGKARFGTGAIEGVLGPGAANNSTLGASLIPTIAFGIPGGAASAILLGALLIHGITPGPNLLTTRLPLTMSFVWVIVIANLITVLFCLLFLKQIARITFVRGALLIPSLVVLVYVGAFAEKNAMLDMGIVLLSGMLGLAMTYLGWPRPPLILGLVLGRLMEVYLFRSVARYDATWLSRPLVLVLLALSLAVLLAPVIQSVVARALPRRPQPS